MAWARVHRDEGGQALIVIALAVIVLLGAVAFGLDWGYGLTQRRVMVNAAEAGALAGAKVLATNVIQTKQGTMFTSYEEAVYCAALRAATANRDYRPGTSLIETTIVEWNTEPMQRDPVTNEPAYTPFATANCPPPGTPITTGTVADPAVRYVRVRTTVSYRPLLAFVVGQTNIAAAGVGVARITGGQADDTGPTWPLVRHYDPNDFVTDCQVSCNPGNAQPTTFWDANDDDLNYGDQSKGLVDFSRYSPYVQADLNTPSTYRDNCTDPSRYCVPQLMTNWDRRGQLAAFPGEGLGGGSGDTRGSCSPPATYGQWLTRGNEKQAVQNKDCSIPNWAYHLFGGTLSLTSDYTGISYGTTQPDGTTDWRERPEALSSTRTVCSTTLPIEKPSCENSAIGDWVEIAASGTLGAGIATPLREYIEENGKTDEWYARRTPTGNDIYGKYVVIPIYLWDCAEWYDPKGTGGDHWRLTMPKRGSDCSAIHDGNDLAQGAQVNRVHLFTVVPFTFYKGLVDGSKISGFWGGKIGDATMCQRDATLPQCQLNAISNGIFLVAPD